MKNLNEMNKAELRAACKAVGVKGYGNMDNAAMRTAIMIAEDDAKNIAETGYKECPHCKTTLQNGYWPVETLIDTLHNDGSRKQAIETDKEAKFSFYCSCCGEYFGAPRTPRVAKAEAASVGTGIKIEKVREEKNGIKRPSAGGVCRAIWDFCSAQPKAPTLKEVKAEAAVQGWDLVTTSVQYYQWRKFSGIVGRI
jgi:hypothetical protein